MRRIKFSPSLVAIVAEWLPGHTDEELASHLAELTGEPFSELQAKNWRASRRIPCGRRKTKEERHSRRIDPEVMEDIRNFTPGHTDKELAEYLSKVFNKPYDRKKAKGFRINHDIPLGKPIEGGGKFQKGHKSWSKGIHTGRRSINEFKKGHIPSNTLPLGTRTKSYFSNGSYRWKTKIGEPNIWEFDHRLIWEKAHGPIPEDHVVMILDQDPDHLELDNLICVSKAVLSQFNKNPIQTKDREINRARVKLAEYKREINLKRKELKK